MGRAEQRKYPVAGRLRHVSVVVMHGVHHDLQCRVDDGARLFRIEIFDQFHRTLDIGEKRGHGFALAFERRLEALVSV